MSLKMSVETAVNVSFLHLKELHKIGWVQYRIRLYYLPKDCSQKIHFMAYNIAVSPEPRAAHNDPRIAEDSHCAYSHKMPVQYLNDAIPDNSTYYFKVYLDLTLLERISVELAVDLLFAENPACKFEPIQRYRSRLNAYHNVLTYLPVVFDHYGTVSMSGSLHAAIMEYKFDRSEDDSHLLQNQYRDFQTYFEALTLGFRHAEIVNFYNYYRRSLENELTGLLERVNELGEALQQNVRKSKYIKLSHNKRLTCILEEIYQINFIALTAEQKAKLVEALLEDFTSIKALIYQNWNEANQFINLHSQPITLILKVKYQDQLRERMKANVFSHRIKNYDWTFNRYNDMSRSHLEQANTVRKKSESEQELWGAIFPIENTSYFQDSQKSIKIFEQIYQTGSVLAAEAVPETYEHVIFLVHGFQAHRNDLIPMKSCLQARHRVKVHISASNIGKTEDSLLAMGRRLAIEVTKYLELIKRPFKLSFIGHSMGGLIIRSALGFLSQLHKHLHAYVSICSPHLGYLYTPSKLVQAGLWLLNAWQKCESIVELSMQDNQNLRECFLYKLAGEPHMNNFKKMAFLASSQDEYVPYDSAIVVKNTVLLTQNLKNRIESQIICEMVDNLLCETSAAEISRIDVIFSIDQKNFDSFIGRTGHVRFLCDPFFIKQFAVSLEHLFL